MKQSGRLPQITCQVGESLVAAELGRQGFICSTFNHNVPEFDILAIDESLKRTLPIQVKAIRRGGGFQSTADKWMCVKPLDEEKRQYVSRKEISNPEMVYVLVEVGDKYAEDRFFVLTKQQLSDTYYRSHYRWLEARDWKRPRKPESLHCSLTCDELPKEAEGNWSLLSKQ